MADTKISAMTALAQGDVVVGTDVLPIVDVGSPNLNKRITPQALVGSAVTDLVQTWNSAGTTFTAVKMNVTDTASAAGSLLLDLQRNAATAFSVAKTGIVRIVDTAAGRDLRIEPSTTGAFHRLFSSNTTAGFSFENNAGVLGTFSAATGLGIGSNADLFLNRDAADTLAQRRGTNAQTFRLYNTFTDASNYERGELSWSGNNFTVGTAQAGTGITRRLTLSGSGDIVLSTAYSQRWNISGAGHFLATVDNTYDIGASGANRPRAIFVATAIECGGNIEATGYVQTTATSGFRLGSFGWLRGSSDGVFLIFNNAGTDFNRLQFGGTTSSFPALKRNATAINVRLADDSADAPLTAGRITAQTLTIGLGGQTAVASNTALGSLAFNSGSLTGIENTGVGRYVGQVTTSGSYLSALGHAALSSNTTGSYNTAIGVDALKSNTTANSNSALGAYALTANTTGGSNSVVGVQALFSNTTGNNNSALGAAALYSNTTGGNNSALGWYALFSNTTGSGNSAVGVNALYSNTTGGDNSAVGIYALYSNTTGINNSAIGRSALNSNTTGDNNIAVGLQSLRDNTTGGNNSAVGVNALFYNTTASNNSALGFNALLNFNTSNNVAVGFEAARGSATVANNTGINLTAVGYRALLNNTSGSNNSASGGLALISNTAGDNNSAMGYAALYSNTTGSNNSALGGTSLYSNTTGNDNTTSGRQSLYNNTTGSQNSAFGFNALLNNTTGSNNIGIGEEAGDVITTGARNTIVGANSDPSANNGNDQTVIGEGLTGKGNDTAFIGGTNGAYNEKNVTTWETTSDARIKKDIADFADGLEVLEQVRVRSFRYRTPEEITDLPSSAAINQPGVQLGVIAQELQEILPQCVTENSTGVLSVNTDPLVWYLINAVQQLSAEVKALKGE